MIYPSDNYTFVFPMVNTTGANPVVTVAPTITIINTGTGAAVVTAAAMTLVAGTQKVYTYVWAIPSNQALGDYFAIVSTAYDTTTLNSSFLSSVRLGDARVTGAVALDATVAKDSTVAKDLTVAHGSDISAVNPANSSIIAAIKAKTDLITNDPATGTLQGAATALLNDIRDAVGGSWIIDKTVSPNVLSLHRIADGTLLFSYQLTDSASTTNRNKI